MISPVAAALFASPLYPTAINNNLTNNALQLKSQAYNSDQGDIKVDYRPLQQGYDFGPLHARLPDRSGNQFAAPVRQRLGHGADLERCRRLDAVLPQQPGQRLPLRLEPHHLNTGSTFDKSVGAFGQSIGIREFESDWTRSDSWASILVEERRPVPATARSPTSETAW